MRRVKIENEDSREGIEKVIRTLGIETEIEKVRRVGAIQEDGRGMVMVTLGSVERKSFGEKGEIEEKRRKNGGGLNLGGEKIRWRLREVARRERKK